MVVVAVAFIPFGCIGTILAVCSLLLIYKTMFVGLRHRKQIPRVTNEAKVDSEKKRRVSEKTRRGVHENLFQRSNCIFLSGGLGTFDRLILNRSWALISANRVMDVDLFPILRSYRFLLLRPYPIRT